MGFAGLLSHAGILRALDLDMGARFVAPALSSILDRTYSFGRLYLLYVTEAASGRPEVQSFLQPLIVEKPERAVRSGLVPVSDRAYEAVAWHLEDGETPWMLGARLSQPCPCREKHRVLLNAHGFVGSMSPRGNPYDNPKAESFMKPLKIEAVYVA